MLRPEDEEEEAELVLSEAAEAEADRPPLPSAAEDCDERSRCLAAPVDDMTAAKKINERLHGSFQKPLGESNRTATRVEFGLACLPRILFAGLCNCSTREKQTSSGDFRNLKFAMAGWKFGTF
jgi:hypothetical protein